MKKYLLTIMAGVIFLNAFVTNDVSAQTLKVVRAEVPFEFRVGDKIYPAGNYRLESISQLNKNILQLRGIETNNQRLLVTSNLFASRWQSPKLVFYRIGEQYYLTNIFMEDGNWGFSIRMSRSKLENGKKLASKKIVEVPVKN